MAIVFGSLNAGFRHSKPQRQNGLRNTKAHAAERQTLMRRDPSNMKPHVDSVITWSKSAMPRKSAFMLLLAFGPCFGADPEAIRDKVTAMVKTADQAAASGQSAEAENGYKAAIAQCDLLPPAWYHCKADVLRSLGVFYGRSKDNSKEEATYKERLDILVSNQKDPVKFPDLEIGNTLFDLQSLIEAGNLTNADREADGLSYVKQAQQFYEHGKTIEGLQKTCDRRLADVDGLHGSVLLLKQRFDEAERFLKAVVARTDSGVRKEVLTAALKGYATILIKQGKTSEAQELMQRVQRLEASPK